jgi:hypothetical protein
MYFGQCHSQLLPFCEYRFAPSKSPVKVQPKILDILLGRFTLFMWTGEQVSPRVVNVTWTYLNSLAFILHLFNHFCIVSMLVYSFCEAMPGSLSMANTAVLSANVAVVDSVKVGWSTVYSRHCSGPRTLPWGTPALTEESSVYADSNFRRKCVLCRWDLSYLRMEMDPVSKRCFVLFRIPDDRQSSEHQ